MELEISTDNLVIIIISCQQDKPFRTICLYKEKARSLLDVIFKPKQKISLKPFHYIYNVSQRRIFSLFVSICLYYSCIINLKKPSFDLLDLDCIFTLKEKRLVVRIRSLLTLLKYCQLFR